MLNMVGFVEYFQYVEVYILNIKGFTINGEEETIGLKNMCLEAPQTVINFTTRTHL